MPRRSPKAKAGNLIAVITPNKKLSAKVGFLPLYLKLYDDVLPEMREKIDQYSETIQHALKEHGLKLIAAPVCREADEFEKAAALFDDACAVVTLHLAYSPSLESADALAAIGKPLIMLDTTPDHSFNQSVKGEDILYNHGIHGVQDLCSVLKRRGVPYFVEAGHWKHSNVLERVTQLCKAAYAAAAMKTGKVGLIGTSFKGMGDFYITADELAETIGTRVVTFDFNERAELASSITRDDVEAEMADDLARFETGSYDKKAHMRTVRTNLLVRKWVEKNELNAYSMNFAYFERARGFESVPFIEACKSMARGIGYAGEGDVLTAALCGALLQFAPESSFTEMFCPDWKGNSIFLSHMGEMNPVAAKGKMKLTTKEYTFSDVDAPMMAYGCFKAGQAVLVNLAQTLPGKFTLILSNVEVLDVDGDDGLKESIRGWIRPELPVSDFLEKYSMAGGTHHLMMVYGDALKSLTAFGQMMGFSVDVL